MSILVVLIKFVFSNQTNKNLTRRRCRYSARFPCVGIQDIVVVFLGIPEFSSSKVLLSSFPLLIPALVWIISVNDALMSESMGLNKYHRLFCIIGGADGLVIFLLAITDDGLHWEPRKTGFHLESNSVCRRRHTRLSPSAKKWIGSNS